MAKFEKKFTEDQEQAIIAAVLDRGMTQRKARLLAERGELVDLAPFVMSKGKVSIMVQDERERRSLVPRRRRGGESPAEIVERMLAGAVEREEREHAAIIRGSKLDEPRMARHLKRLATLRKLVQDDPKPGPSTNAAKDTDEPKDHDSVLERARREMQRQDTASTDPSETPHEADTLEGAEAHDEATPPAEEQPREKDAAPVSSRVRLAQLQAQNGSSAAGARAGD